MDNPTRGLRAYSIVRQLMNAFTISSNITAIYFVQFLSGEGWGVSLLQLCVANKNVGHWPEQEVFYWNLERYKLFTDCLTISQLAFCSRKTRYNLLSLPLDLWPQVCYTQCSETFYFFLFGKSPILLRPYHPNVTALDDDKSGSIGEMLGRGNRSTRRNPAAVPLCPPQIPYDLTRTRTWAAVGSRRLTAWATARPQWDRRLFYTLGRDPGIFHSAILSRTGLCKL
jgi:hypothetical protein